MLHNDLLQIIKDYSIKAYVNTLHPLLLSYVAKKVGRKEKIEVVFFAMNVALWRYQGIYDMMSKDKRFNCHIVFTVNKGSSVNSKRTDLAKMREYFGKKGIDYIDHNEMDLEGYEIKKRINPDILFYPQHYGRMHPKNHNYTLFLCKLLCYIPYSASSLSSENWGWQYDLTFQNFAWKLYYPFNSNLVESRTVAKNHARNMVISGYPNMDYYLSDEFHDVWKLPAKSHKRLIWAPHFTVVKDLSALNRSNFLSMSEFMLDIAKKYKDKLQIAFKPHPSLKMQLYNHPNWGYEKTDEYYEKWAKMENTMLETGDFLDLFKSSDAMIHDSCSFMVEYLFVNKPVAFVVKSENKIHQELSEFSEEMLEHHYLVRNNDEILSFIEDVIFRGRDPKFGNRKKFLEEKLKPRNTQVSTSQFIIDDIKRSLGID